MRGLNPGISVPHSVVIFVRQKPVPPKSERLRAIYVKGGITGHSAISASRPLKPR